MEFTIPEKLQEAVNAIGLNSDQYVRKDDLIYIKTEFSNCILTLKINESNQLMDIETNEIVGQLSPAKCLFAR